MPGNPDQQGLRGSRVARALLLLVAGLWLLVLLVCVFNPLPVLAAVPRLSIALAPSASVPPLPTTPPTAPAMTPTSVGGGQSTPTAAAGTMTPTAAATAQPTAANNGGGDGGIYTGIGAQPTRVVLAQPTAGVSDASGLQALSPAAIGSNGLLIATSLSCVSAILGIVIVFVALSALLRTGYGPFLRALVLGKRASNGEGSAAYAGRGGRGRQGRWNDRDDTMNGRDGFGRDAYGDNGYRGYDDRDAAPAYRPGGAPARGAPAQSRARPRQGVPSRGRTGRQ